MSWQDRWVSFCKALSISWFDFIILLLFTVGAFIYLHNENYWSVGNIGDAPYGDAEFWWSGALHVAQGIFQDNPGKGFRPGYFILTGLTLPVLGQQFHQYYFYFLCAFLAVTIVFYLALRQVLGRWGAFCVIGMLAFNPFTAEWLATSTTDSTGLLLHLAALSCLLFGFSKGLHRNWLIGFSLLFALATLTRPLMTPFIGMVLLAILCLANAPIKKRINISICVFIAFCLPTLLWMGAQKIIINQWSISTNDASAIYAASDPAIQVWTPSMYSHIEQLAALRYHTNQLTDQQLNQIFWEETVKNYLNYPTYHLKRIVPHVWELVRFTPSKATRGSNVWQVSIFIALMAGLSLMLILKRNWLRLGIVISLGISIFLSPITILAYMTLIGAALGFITRSNPTNRLGMFLLSSYWLTGMVALLLTGGVWGPPLGATFDLNALGYRLGAQVFFMNDLLAAYCLIWIATFTFKPVVSKLSDQSASFFHSPAILPGGVVLGTLSFFFVATMGVYLIGGGMVFERTYHRLYADTTPYPSLTNTMQLLKQEKNITSHYVKGKDGGLGSELDKKNIDLLFTGAVSPFVWNMQGQERAQLMVHAQKQITPFTMGPNFVILEVPQHISIKEWEGMQGAFIIRQFANNHNESNQAYYISSPAIRAFIPLSPDGKDFLFSKAIWFPLVKNATQLETSGEMIVKNANVKWVYDSGQAKYQRRFYLSPQKADRVSSEMELVVNVSHAKGPKKLSFSYAIENKIEGNEKKNTLNDYHMIITTISKQHKKQILSRHEIAPTQDDGQLRHIEFSIPNNVDVINISFNHFSSAMGVWIYELNLSAADFATSSKTKQ